MGWWEEQVVSRLVKCGCGSERMGELRAPVVSQAHGAVFELGCGAGANQPFYDPAKVTRYCAVEPGDKLRGYAVEAAANRGFDADIRDGVGEAIPFADESFDTVVCTFTMCSVHDHAQSLRELRRVLKSGGLFLFAEHGRSDEPAIARWQERIDPVWSRIMGNCHLSRPVSAAMTAAGFAVTPIARQYREGPRVVSWMEWGTARKAG